MYLRGYEIKDACLDLSRPPFYKLQAPSSTKASGTIDHEQKRRESVHFLVAKTSTIDGYAGENNERENENLDV